MQIDDTDLWAEITVGCPPHMWRVLTYDGEHTVYGCRKCGADYTLITPTETERVYKPKPYRKLATIHHKRHP